MFARLKTLILGRTEHDQDFDRTLSAKLKCTDRVRHRSTGEAGTVFQTGQYNSQSGGNIPAVSVRYDNGSEALLVPAEEFTKWMRYR